MERTPIPIQFIPSRDTTTKYMSDPDIIAGHDVEACTIVAGNPARVIRQRFDDGLTALMLEWKWWDCDRPADSHFDKQ